MVNEGNTHNQHNISYRRFVIKNHITNTKWVTMSLQTSFEITYPTLILSYTDLAINFLRITENPCALTTPTSQYQCS